MAAAVLVILLLVPSWPAYGADAVREAVEAFSEELMERGGAALRDLYRPGQDLLDDSVDLDLRIEPETAGKGRRAELILRLFPKGKLHSLQNLTAQGKIQLLPEWQGGHFMLDLKVYRFDPDDYL